MALLRAEQLSLKQGAKYLVKDIDWQIEQGENWVLFGLNGCGKTTLLSILAGYKSGSQGKNYLFDQEVTAENFLTLRREVGLVSSSFFGRYLQRENVIDIVLAGKHGALGLQEDTITGADVRQAKQLLNELGIGKSCRYPYDTLSRGQQQRVLIARALMGEPKLILLDEPCSGLDILAREQFLSMLQAMMQEKGITIVYVTHHTEEILPFFDRAALMREGQLHSVGHLQEIFTDENLTGFFGVETKVLWTDRHFFINVNLAGQYPQQGQFHFAGQGG